MIVVGSRAAEFHSVLSREPRDWDLILPLQDIFRLSVEHGDEIEYLYPKNEWKFKGKMRTGEHLEIEVADYNPSAMWLWERREQFLNTDDLPIGQFNLATRFPMRAPDLGYLMLMKRSHLYWNVHWQKSIKDYHLMKIIMAATGEKLTSEMEEFYKLRILENVAKFGPLATVNYDVSNEEFFGRSSKINRVFAHDELHEAVKLFDQPMYLVCKTEKDQAALNECLFHLLDESQQRALVTEEAMVIALERKIIPQTLQGAPIDAHAAYQYALQRLCTNLSDGWFREYAIENWSVLSRVPIDYVARFREHFHQ